MRRVAKCADHPRKLTRMTGLTLDQFQEFTARLTPLWEQAEQRRLSQRKRQHAIGQGTKYKLATMADKLLCVLAFYRFALTDELLGWLVGLDASNVCRLQQRLEPLLEQAADPSLGLSLRRRLPPGVKKIGTWEELLERCPDFADVVTDATEQPVSGHPVERSAGGTPASASATRSRPNSRSVGAVAASSTSAPPSRAESMTTPSSSGLGWPSACRRRRTLRWIGATTGRRPTIRPWPSPCR